MCDADGKLKGVITDGDLRRTQVKLGVEAFQRVAAEIMTSNPKTIEESSLAVEALRLMENHSISDLMIIDSAGQPTGVIHLKDLLKAGVV